MQHPIHRMLCEAADREDGYTPKGAPPDAEIDTLGLPPALRAEFVETCGEVAVLALGGESEDAQRYANERAGEIIVRLRSARKFSSGRAARSTALSPSSRP